MAGAANDVFNVKSFNKSGRLRSFSMMLFIIKDAFYHIIEFWCSIISKVNTFSSEDLT